MFVLGAGSSDWPQAWCLPAFGLGMDETDAASAKAGQASAVDYAAENARLRAENLELRRMNELLKEASAFFASELGPRARK